VRASGHGLVGGSDTLRWAHLLRFDIVEIFQETALSRIKIISAICVHVSGTRVIGSAQNIRAWKTGLSATGSLRPRLRSAKRRRSLTTFGAVSLIFGFGFSCCKPLHIAYVVGPTAGE
jgi:hypothetical protein